LMQVMASNERGTALSLEAVRDLESRSRGVRLARNVRLV
jgi:hypothetical protein